jgi:hypothetical protein
MRQNELHDHRFYNLLVFPVLAVGVSAFAVRADDASKRKPQTAAPKTYLLVCPEDEGVWKSRPKDIHWQTGHKMLDEQAEKLIRVVHRATVDKSLDIDTEGL